MENSIEQIVEQERRKGWLTTLIAGREGWVCLLECHNETIAANQTRATAGGPSALAALIIAIRERDKRYGRQKMVAA